MELKSLMNDEVKYVDISKLKPHPLNDKMYSMEDIVEMFKIQQYIEKNIPKQVRQDFKDLIEKYNPSVEELLLLINEEI